MADLLKVKVIVGLGKVAVEKSAEYPADTFEQADRAIPFAAEMLGDAVLEALVRAGLHPEPQKGGEDKGIRDAGV